MRRSSVLYKEKRIPTVERKNDMEKQEQEERKHIEALDRKIERLQEKVIKKHKEYSVLAEELSTLLDERHPERKIERAKQAASNGTNLQNRWDCVPLPCFQGFSGFRPSFFAASSMGQKTDLQLNQNSAKNQAVPPWASASSAGPLFVAELPL